VGAFVTAQPKVTDMAGGCRNEVDAAMRRLHLPQRQFIADEQVESSATEGKVVFDPLGVVLAVMPWNFFRNPRSFPMTTTNARQPTVLRPGEIKAHERGGGARTIPLVTASVGSTTFINGITEFDPGVAIPFHSHNCEESVMLLEGDAILDIEGKEIPLRPQDTTWIPPNVPHRFRNMSQDLPMKIFWTYARADATRTLVETGTTNFVSEEHDK
jgi:quercetin dioxygenase-like cupin family protein